MIHRKQHSIKPKLSFEICETRKNEISSRQYRDLEKYTKAISFLKNMEENEIKIMIRSTSKEEVVIQ
ncbi:hypothetical protein FACS189451_03370 [Bacteroidia bacterium]|nr:hypothetical protein FACS189451_03370 [Bacteroidia bacterium]